MVAVLTVVMLQAAALLGGVLQAGVLHDCGAPGGGAPQQLHMCQPRLRVCSIHPGRGSRHPVIFLASLDFHSKIFLNQGQK